MAETGKQQPDTTEDPAAETAPAGRTEQGWKPTAEAKAKATRFRIIAWVLWIVAIAGEAVAIFWLLGPSIRTDAVTTDDRGVVTVTEGGFPDWALWTLIAVIVVIGVLSVIGSQLWKKANRLDPASKQDKVRFFVQNQLGAIVALIAFVPLIIMVFLNKDMNGQQKAIAGTIGIVVAAAAVALGIDFKPPSVEQYNLEASAVVQLFGKDEAWWTPSGTVYHPCEASIPAGSSGALNGTIAEGQAAVSEHRLSLNLDTDLRACGIPVPENYDAIRATIEEIQSGNENVVIPAPVWPAGYEAPSLDDLLPTGA